MDSVVKTEEEKKNTFNAGFTEEGFFTCFIHESKGVRELLGFMDQCKDLIKQYYARKLMEDAKAKGLVRPDGILNGFRNKWRK